MLATLITNVNSGLARTEDNKSEAVQPFIGRTGVVVETDEAWKYEERPTGYESTLHLVDFDGIRLWLPESTWEFGPDSEKFIRVLKLSQQTF